MQLRVNTKPHCKPALSERELEVNRQPSFVPYDMYLVKQ